MRFAFQRSAGPLVPNFEYVPIVAHDVSTAEGEDAHETQINPSTFIQRYPNDNHDLL